MNPNATCVMDCHDCLGRDPNKCDRVKRDRTDCPDDDGSCSCCGGA